MDWILKVDIENGVSEVVRLNDRLKKKLEKLEEEFLYFCGDREVWKDGEVIYIGGCVGY